MASLREGDIVHNRSSPNILLRIDKIHSDGLFDATYRQNPKKPWLVGHPATVTRAEGYAVVRPDEMPDK